MEIINKVNNSFTYINTQDIYFRKSSIGAVGVFHKDNDNYEFVYPYITGNKKENINLNNINRLIPLQKFYKEAMFLPRECIIQGCYKIIVLYEYQGLTISIFNNVLRVDYNLKIKDEKLLNKDEYIQYLDFDFLMLELDKMLKNKLEANRKRLR